MSKDLLSLGFDIAWEITLPQIPASVDIAAETGISFPTPVTSHLDDAQRSLKDARQDMVYYQEAFWGLAGFIFFLMLLITLVNFNLKRTCLVLGITFSAYGILEAAGILFARALLHSRLASLSDAPVSLRPWLVQLADAATKPLLIFGAAFAAAGIILIVVSILYHGRTQQTTAA
jgi:hypothetical protein